MTTAVFRLREAESEDIPAMAALDVSAFLDSPMHKAMFPEHLRVKPGVQDQVDWNMSRMISGFADPRTHFTVVTTKRPEGGYIIVGCAEWRSPIPASERGNAVLEKEKEKEEEAEKSDEEKELDLEQRLARLPSCLDKKAVLAANDEIQQLLVDSKDCFKGKERSEMWSKSEIHFIFVANEWHFPPFLPPPQHSSNIHTIVHQLTFLLPSLF